MPMTPPSRSLRQELVKLSFCPFCTYAGGNDLLYLNHIIIAHYNASYRCGKCLKQAFISSLALHTHKKVCLGLTSRKAARVPDGKPSSGGGDSGTRGSSNATPKKDSKVATTNSQGLSAPSASQPSPCHSGRGTSHHHKSHKKDSGEKQKKANNVSPACKSTGYKAHRDGGHRLTGIPPTSTAPRFFSIKTLLHRSHVCYNSAMSSIIKGSECKEQTYNVM